MSKNLSRWRTWTALLAAYALAIQTLFLALTLGAHAGQAISPDLHVLCLPSGQAPDNAPAPADTAHQPDCCVLGGNLLGKLLVPPQTQAVVAPQAEAVAPAAMSAETLFLARPHSPLTARGPPAA